MITDALHNAADAIVSFASWFGLRVSQKKPSEKFPYGHGYATEQLIYEGIAYTIDRDNQARYLERSALDYAVSRGGQIMGTHRVNDLTRLSSTVLDIDKLAFSLFLIGNEGANVVVELAENKPDPKTGKRYRE